MRPLRISQKQYLVVAILLLGLSLSPTNGLRAEFEFITQNIGFPVQYFEPVDIEGDGIWELALQVGHAGDSVGIYSSLLRKWIDGPHWLSVEGNNWGCGDFDGDSPIEYVYLVGNQVIKCDPVAMRDTLLFEVPYTPSLLQIWGNTETGEPLVNLCHYKREHKPYDGWCEGDEVTESSHWLRYSAVTGILVDSLDGWKKRGILCFADTVPPTPYLCVFDFNYYSYYCYSMPWPTVHDCGYSVLLLSQQSSIIDEMVSVQQSGFGEWPPCYGVEAKHITIGRQIGEEEYEVFWQLENYVFGWWLIEGKTLPTDSPTWSYDLNSKPYVSIAYHDIDSNAMPELLLPLAARDLWEIRDPQTGVLIDSIPGLPPVDIRTAPIMDTDTLDLYYIVDSTLYILNRPGLPVSVFNDEDKALLSTLITLHQNYPNPFNTSTVIKFDLDQPASVKLDIYNILGQKVATLLNTSLPAGFHQVEWDGKNDNGQNVVSGMYFYRLITGDLARTKKMAFLK